MTTKSKSTPTHSSLQQKQSVSSHSYNGLWKHGWSESPPLRYPNSPPMSRFWKLPSITMKTFRMLVKSSREGHSGNITGGRCFSIFTNNIWVPTCENWQNLCTYSPSKDWPNLPPPPYIIFKTLRYVLNGFIWAILVFLIISTWRNLGAIWPGRFAKSECPLRTNGKISKPLKKVFPPPPPSNVFWVVPLPCQFADHTTLSLSIMEYQIFTPPPPKSIK